MLYYTKGLPRMVICKDLEHIHHFDKSVITIGSLDGMHRGHLEIISDLQSVSNLNNIPSVVITFDPHPKTVLNTSRKSMECLISTYNKMELLKKYSVDYVWIIPFDKEFSQISATKFMKKYVSKYFNPLDVIIGYDHHFGCNREGGREFLLKNEKIFGYNLHIKEPILYYDMPISSSRIRSYLRGGDINNANECLGWEYKISGTIVIGEGRGAQLNFPTANIIPHIPNQLLPKNGVYCVDAIIEGTYYTGMCNIGQRPTFYENGEQIIEVHLFTNDSLNLYGKDIIITFKKYLRKEIKYNSSSELIKQLKLDRQACFAI
jgi:riboflavin kinase/FMN adenylyltransferase